MFLYKETAKINISIRNGENSYYTLISIRRQESEEKFNSHNTGFSINGDKRFSYEETANTTVRIRDEENSNYTLIPSRSPRTEEKHNSCNKGCSVNGC